MLRKNRCTRWKHQKSDFTIHFLFFVLHFFCFLLYTLRCVSVFLSNFPWFPIHFRYWNDSKLRTRLFIRLRNDLTLCRQDSGQFGLILWYNLIVFFLIVEGRGENEESKREPRVEGGGGANSKRQERITEKLYRCGAKPKSIPLKSLSSSKAYLPWDGTHGR